METKRQSRITVLLTREEARSFDAYCREGGFKKSTLIVKLIRERLEHAGFTYQASLALDPDGDES